MAWTSLPFICARWEVKVKKSFRFKAWSYPALLTMVFQALPYLSLQHLYHLQLMLCILKQIKEAGIVDPQVIWKKLRSLFPGLAIQTRPDSCWFVLINLAQDYARLIILWPPWVMKAKESLLSEYTRLSPGCPASLRESLGCNPIHSHLGVSPIVYIRIYFYVNMHRIELLIGTLIHSDLEFCSPYSIIQQFPGFFHCMVHWQGTPSRHTISF